MPDPNTIEVNIAANTGSYVAAMKEAASTTGSTATAIQSEIGAISSSANAAHAPMGAFTNIIKDYRQEVRTEGRYSRFLAADIASMGIASKGAAGEVTSLVAALAFGGGMGAGIEFIKMTVKAFTELAGEEAKAKEELKQLADGAVEYGKKMKEHVEDVLAGLRGETQSEALARKEVLPLLKQEAEAHMRIAAAKSNRQIAEQQVAVDEMQAFARNAAIAQAEEEEKKAQAELAAVQAKLVEARKAVGEVGTGEQGKAEEEEAEKAKELREQRAIDEAKALGDELRDYKKHYDQVTAETLKFMEDQSAAEEKNALDTAKIRAAEVNDYKKHYDEITAETLRALQEQVDAETAAAKKVADEQRRQLAAVQRAAEGAAKSMGAEFGAAFSGMIQGSEDVGSAFKNMLKATLKAILDVAIASITASAAKAAAEAAASQAGVPIVGPILAVGAMAAMESVVMGLIDSLPSAAGGYDIPTMSNPLVQAHGGEMILPRDIADPLRESLNGGGAAEEHMHVHIHGAIDGDSVRRVVNSDHFVRALRDAHRNGRMP